MTLKKPRERPQQRHPRRTGVWSAYLSPLLSPWCSLTDALADLKDLQPLMVRGGAFKLGRILPSYTAIVRFSPLARTHIYNIYIKLKCELARTLCGYCILTNLLSHWMFESP